MALFKDTEKRKEDKVKNLQKIASLKKVLNYVSREDKIGTVDEVVNRNNELKSINEEFIIEEMLKRKDDALFKYITQGKKTEEKLVTGINCRASSAFDEMMVTKKMFNKTDGRQFKHFVHSYSKHEKNLTPEMAHEITLKLLEHEKFKGFQILVTTHVDTDTIHSHIAVNSVNMETGLKWKHSLGDLFKITDFSNRLCAEYGLEHSFIDNRKSKFTNKKEYYLGEKLKEEKRSWKHEAFLSINSCKKTATSKEDFIDKLEKLGYKVRWKDSRKNIQFSFIAPDGKEKKINNDKFHPKKIFTKESLEKSFYLNSQWQERKKDFDLKVKFEAKQELVLQTIKILEENPDIGNGDYPRSYLEDLESSQAIKEKMKEKAKGEGLNWGRER